MKSNVNRFTYIGSSSTYNFSYKIKEIATAIKVHFGENKIGTSSSATGSLYRYKVMDDITDVTFNQLEGLTLDEFSMIKIN